MHPRLLVVALSFASALLATDFTSSARAESLLARPEVSFQGKLESAPKGYWGVVNAGKGHFEYFTEDGFLGARMSSLGEISRLQFGAYSIDAAKLAAHHGRTVRISAEVSGYVERLAEKDGFGPVLQVQFIHPSRTVSLSVGPHMLERANSTQAPQIEGSFGDVPSTPLQIVTRLPEGTEKINVLCYLMNAQGELEWRRVRLELAADDLAHTHPAPASLRP